MRVRLERVALGVAWLLVASSATPETDEQHFTLKVRVEPERVVPGGWIDVIAELEFEPGWHATSPRSPNGPRGSFNCEVPSGFEAVGDVLVEESTPRTDPLLGRVELLEGKVELRRRYAVPPDANSTSHPARVRVGLTVCDAFRCLPRIVVEAQASIAVDSGSGRLAPAPARTTAIAPPDEDERRLLAEQGYLVRARQESACHPGEAAFVLLEFLLEPGSTLGVRTVERNAPELGERRRGFEPLPLSWPVEPRNGEATLDRAARAYLVFRTSVDLDPGAYEVPYLVTAARDGNKAWVEQRLTLALVLSKRP